MIQRFFSLVNARPSAPALVEGDSGRVTSRQALLARAREMEGDLSRAGLAPGDAVALKLPNSVDFVAAVVAALEMGLVVLPIDRDAAASEVASILGHFALRGLIYRSDRLDPAISVRETGVRLPLPPGSFLVKLTSGSTGAPRGIVTTAESLAADCEHICSSMGIGPEDLNLGTIPLSHSYGFSNLVMPLLLQGTPVVLSNEYLPQSLLDIANRERCTVAPLIPMVFDHLVSAAHGRFETVRTFISAGSPLPADTSKKFRQRFGIPVHTFYGCSECGGITYDREGSAVERGTVGAPLDGVRLSVENGRLSVYSDSVAAGYLVDATTFIPIAGGAFTTDDLVEAQGEEIVITGRAGDLINTAGRKVNPREIEAVILQMEGVREVKVFGAAAGARGEVVAAAVVATPDVTRDAVRQFCRLRLSPHKVPRIVKLIDQMPVDERGKVKKAVLATL